MGGGIFRGRKMRVVGQYLSYMTGCYSRGVQILHGWSVPRYNMGICCRNRGRGTLEKAPDCIYEQIYGGEVLTGGRGGTARWRSNADVSLAWMMRGLL
eukprot:747260-Hanusia_phi.AAC.1